MTRTEIENILTAQRGRLLNLAQRFIKVSDSAAYAENIVQEALTELWMLFESGYKIRNAEALAVKITKTVCVKHYRRQKLRTSAIEGKDFSGGTSASERVEMLEAIETRNYLWSHLNETQKRYLQMRDEEAMTLDEIALATGHPKVSIKATISQARKTMYELLKKM
ncbi:MAG: RNA polymerase sigma factor [Candidatus Cryptobacteroides sp.]